MRAPSRERITISSATASSRPVPDAARSCARTASWPMFVATWPTLRVLRSNARSAKGAHWGWKLKSCEHSSMPSFDVGSPTSKRIEHDADNRNRSPDEALRCDYRRGRLDLTGPPRIEMRSARPERFRQDDDVQMHARACASELGHGALRRCATRTTDLRAARLRTREEHALRMDDVCRTSRGRAP